MANLSSATPLSRRATARFTGLAVAAIALNLAACSAQSSPDLPPSLPPGVYGTYEDNATGALNQASWAFASAANTRNNPVAAIRAIVALEYLPEELSENPRWIEVDSAIPFRLNQARDDLRRIVGIRPDAPPQQVINALLALSWDLQTGNRAAETQTLASPLFTNPPQTTLATLYNLPFVPAANTATAWAEMESRAGGAGG
jgi:hypothetical protein